LAARREIENVEAGGANDRLGQLKNKMEELVKAYNAYTDQKISINEVIPSELKSYFGIPLEAVCFPSGHLAREDNGLIDRTAERI
jgi:hypothetical protein